MRADKHAFVEVPATMDIDSCWELVDIDMSKMDFGNRAVKSAVNI